MALGSGTKLGPYEICSLLGAGGMGEVYRARDTRLDRDVAIKVLPEAMAGDEQRMLRFEREAKLLASLNHANVAQIYGFEEHRLESGITRFLVLEFVEGETLAARLKRGALPVDEAVETGRQVALALEAAHEKGIIHRDLKPGNVMLRPDGVVKVLDFGLARALAGPPESGTSYDSPTLTLPSPAITSEYMPPGVILGTAAYMSPEQARGNPVDKRTDIWSFGVVLLECLTGESHFGGRTATDSIAAVLHKAVDWSRLPPSTPLNIRRVLDRCVTRELRDRLHHIADARIELDRVEPPPAAGPVSSRRVGIPVTLLVSAIAIILAIWLGALPARSPLDSDLEAANPLAGARFSKLTDFPGSNLDAAISPDGRFVAFVSDRDGPFSVLVGHVDAGDFRNVTLGVPELPHTVAPVRTVGFTRGGSELWLGGGTGHRLRAVPIMGGPVRYLLGEDVVSASWSPDGARLVYHESTEGDPTYVADHDGTNRRLILPSPEGMHQHFPTWSLDGQWIYLVRGRPATLEMDLWRVRPDGTQAERLTQDKLDVQYPAPVDERTVLYTALEMDGAGPWLWAWDVESGISRRATFGLEQYTSVSSDAQGRRLAATVANPMAVLWSVPILSTPAKEEDAKPLDAIKRRRALAPRIRGDAVYFLSSRSSGRDGLWRQRNGKIEEIWRGSETPLLEPAAIAPDGSKIAVVLRRDGGRRIFLLAADGSQLTALNKSFDSHGAAAWSPDGKWVVTGGSHSGHEGLYKISVDGGVAERLVEGQAFNPVWSPRGDLIVYAGAQVQAVAPLLGVRPDGQPVELPKIHLWRIGERARFLPDGSGIVYMQGYKPSQDFWLLDLATMERRALTQLEARAKMRTFDVTPDGTQIIFDRLSDNSDLVLIERKN